MFKVVLTYPFGETPIEEEVLSKIDAKLFQIPCKTEDEVIAAARDADAALCGLEPFTKKVIESLNQCKIISNAGVGVDNIDVESATKNGVIVAYVPDYCVDEVSDHALALLLACARRLIIINNAVKTGLDSDPAKKTDVIRPIHRLQTQTVGVVGLGRIGKALARKAKGLGLRVVGYDPYPSGDMADGLGIELVNLERLIEESDFVSLHTPLTQETHHMFTIDHFKKMKRTAYFINTSRGAVVDEEALLKALTMGYIAGAGIDVTEVEPLSPDNPILKLDNVIITPHMAAYSEESIAYMRRRYAEEVTRVLSGDWPINTVNPEVKENFAKRWDRR